jgi:rare lipoprotein A
MQFGFLDTAQAQTAHGKASFYSHGQKTASGEKFRPSEMTAAHRTLPFNTRVRVTHAGTKRSVVVRINDRGPFIRGRIIDVSRGAAQALGMLGQGVAQVELQVIR